MEETQVLEESIVGARWSLEAILAFREHQGIALSSDDQVALLCATASGEPLVGIADPPAQPRLALVEEIEAFIAEREIARNLDTLVVRDGKLTRTVTKPATMEPTSIEVDAEGRARLSALMGDEAQAVPRQRSIGTGKLTSRQRQRLAKTDKALGSTWGGAGSLRSLKRNLLRAQSAGGGLAAPVGPKP